MAMHVGLDLFCHHKVATGVSDAGSMHTAYPGGEWGASAPIQPCRGLASPLAVAMLNTLSCHEKAKFESQGLTWGSPPWGCATNVDGLSSLCSANIRAQPCCGRSQCHAMLCLL